MSVDISEHHLAVPPDYWGPADEPSPDIVDTEPDDDNVIRHFHRLDIDLTEPPREALILANMLYAGRLSILQSEPGVGKSWLAMWLSVAVMATGRVVVYMDEEGGPELVTERLVALGADATMVAERFHYYAFEARRWTAEDMAALEFVVDAAGDDLSLVVLDSLPDFLAAAGRSEDSAFDVTSFVATVCERFRRAGAAQLLLDHLPKPPTEGRAKRSRYARGSGAKLAKADATLLLEAVDEFDVHQSGRLRLWKTKDRRGQLDLPPLSKAGLALDVTVSDGRLNITEREEVGDGEDELFRPTALMERISRELEGAAQALSKRTIRSLVRGRNEWKDTAMERLVADGFAAMERQGYVSIRPFRDTEKDAQTWQGGPDDDPLG